MKKILHLFKAEKFTEGFVNLMQDSKYVHTFWVFGEEYLSGQEVYLKRENVAYYPRIEIKLHKSGTESQLERFDMIVYHGVFEDEVIKYFCQKKALVKKLALVFWGGDKEKISSWREKTQKRNLMKRELIRNAAAVITLIPQDYAELKRYYCPKGEHFCARYYSDAALKSWAEIQNFPQRVKTAVQIQIGNSATETNNHIKILNLLAQFKEDNIELYVPLSYGNRNYAEKVKVYGKEIFGHKFIPITEFMTLEKYNSFMGGMDIAIYAMTRQQALGNISTSMIGGSKVYLQTNGMLWKYFTETMKCTVTGINEIRKMTFEEFIAYPEEKKLNNREIINKFYSRERAVSQWEDIYAAF